MGITGSRKSRVRACDNPRSKIQVMPWLDHGIQGFQALSGMDPAVKQRDDKIVVGWRIGSPDPSYERLSG